MHGVTEVHSFFSSLFIDYQLNYIKVGVQKKGAGRRWGCLWDLLWGVRRHGYGISVVVYFRQMVAERVADCELEICCVVLLWELDMM